MVNKNQTGHFKITTHLYSLIFSTGKLWSRSLKLAYTLLNKLGTKTEPVLQPGDRVRVCQAPLSMESMKEHDKENMFLFPVLQVALVYPNSDPGMFWVAFYGCLLAEVIPVPIEVPLSRQVKMLLLSSEFLCGGH